MCHWLASGTAIDGGNTWSQIPSAISAVPKPARPVTKPPASAPTSSRKIAADANADPDLLPPPSLSRRHTSVFLYPHISNFNLGAERPDYSVVQTQYGHSQS